MEDDAGLTTQLTAFSDTPAGIIDGVNGEDIADKLLSAPNKKYYFSIKTMVTKLSVCEQPCGDHLQSGLAIYVSLMHAYILAYQ